MAGAFSSAFSSAFDIGAVKAFVYYYMPLEIDGVFKNVASQKVTLFAFDSATGLPKTGDAANLTFYVNKDDAGAGALTDTSATEVDATNAKGLYTCDLTQAETNADKLHFSGKSATANIVVVPLLVYTTPASFTSLNVTNVNTLSGHDPGATLGTSTLTQTQVSGGAYALNSSSFSFNAALDFTTTQKAATLARVTLVDTATTVTNQLTAAAIATGVWQDSTAGDFTAASSIGKSLYTSGVVPGASGGLFIAGSNAATTVNITGNITGNVSGSVGSVTGLTTATIATAIWTDTTASDFTTTSSPGKIVVTQLGGAFTTTSSSVFTTASLANAPGGSLTVSAIWSEALPGAYATGTAGKLLSTAGSASDPLLNSVPGSYASGTAGAALGKIGSGNIDTVSPIAQDGAIEIVRGCDYNNTDGYAIDWTDTNADTAWPTLTSATITIGIEYNGQAFSFSGSVVTATGTPKKVRWEPTAAQTNTLPATTGEGATYKVIATLTSGRIVCLAGDLITVLDNPVR